MDKLKPIHPGNFECFVEVLTKNLQDSLKKHPQDYAYTEKELPDLMPRFRKAIEDNNFNKDGHAFKATCKQLKIKHTYKAIQEFIRL